MPQARANERCKTRGDNDVADDERDQKAAIGALDGWRQKEPGGDEGDDAGAREGGGRRRVRCRPVRKELSGALKGPDRMPACGWRARMCVFRDDYVLVSLHPAKGPY